MRNGIEKLDEFLSALLGNLANLLPAGPDIATLLVLAEVARGNGGRQRRRAGKTGTNAPRFGARDVFADASPDHGFFLPAGWAGIGRFWFCRHWDSGMPGAKGLVKSVAGLRAECLLVGVHERLIPAGKAL